LTRARSGPALEANPYLGVRLLKPIEVSVVDRQCPLGPRPPFSLVATVKDEARGIADFLASIERQSLKPDEVVLVDGGSTDGTAQLIAAHRGSLPIRLHERPGANIAEGRNAAMRAAQNELLVLTDAGCTLHPDFCRNLIGCFAEGVDLVGGVYESAGGARNPAIPSWAVLDWSEFLPSARAVAVRRSLALKIGGFPEHLTLTGEDTLFAIDIRRASRKWVFNRRSVVIWNYLCDPPSVAALSRRYGRGDGESGVGEYRYPGELSELLRQWPYGEVDSGDAVLRDYCVGYLEGRAQRAAVEMTRREIRGVVLMLSEFHVAKPGNRDAQAIAELLGEGFKVVHVSATPLRGPSAAWLDLDLTRLELAYAPDFNWEEFLVRYGRYQDRVCAWHSVHHPALELLLDRIEAKTAKGMRTVASLAEVRQTLPARRLPAGANAQPAAAPAPAVIAAPGRRPSLRDTALGRSALKFLDVSRRYGLGEGLKKALAKVRRAAEAAQSAQGARGGDSPAATASPARRARESPSYFVVSFPGPELAGLERSRPALARFAARGSQVFHVDLEFLRDPAPRYAAREVEPGIARVTLGARRALDPRQDAIDPASLERMLESFEALRGDFAVGSAVCILEHAFWHPVAAVLRDRYGWPVVCDLTGAQAGSPASEIPGAGAERETDLARASALVLVSSPELQQRMSAAPATCALVRDPAELTAAVDGLFPKVSIIVVTYNNLALTRSCLESIFARSQHPHLEVIVVDNASSDGTPDYLRELAKQEERVHIVLNPDNRGFAAANNQGLELARGEYVVLLNNDTMVTPGWINGLLRHLADRAVGMVGPSTNMCGNEAIIHVPYDEATLDGFEPFVRAFQRRHAAPDGFDIDMLSMFCVAMRKQIADEIGPLDERFKVGMFEDTDYSERLKARGYRLVVARDVFVHHHCRSSFGKLPTEEYQRIYDENRRKFEEKWGQKTRY
jgi:GT2 family glycosyltransferase